MRAVVLIDLNWRDARETKIGTWGVVCVSDWVWDVWVDVWINMCWLLVFVMCCDGLNVEMVWVRRWRRDGSILAFRVRLWWRKRNYDEVLMCCCWWCCVDCLCVCFCVVWVWKVFGLDGVVICWFDVSSKLIRFERVFLRF